MKITWNWLKQNIDLKGNVEDLDEILTDLGLEVEGIEPTLAEFRGIFVGEVLDCKKHPEADRLSLCEVSIGKEKNLTIVCGAPNVRQGLKVPVAIDGSTLPFGVLKCRKIRGVFSEGMICSEEELGFCEQSDGIWELDSSYEIGSDLRSCFEQDYTIELSVTPNRPDCLGLRGIVRELSIKTGSPSLIPSPTIEQKELQGYNIDIEDSQACPRYVGVLIEGVQIKESPDWLKQTLVKIGMRPINNVVDLTNYLMVLLGHPMHAFDADLVAQNKIIVRKAKDGEKLKTLDEVERTFDSSDLLICDGERASAIAGVMGGAVSEIHEETKNVFLEVAYFNPVMIRKTSKKQKLHTDASHRFERGMDPEYPLEVAHIATEHIINHCGGEYCGTLDNFANKQERDSIQFNKNLVQRILGIELENDWIQDTLKKLGCTIDSANESTLTVKAPSFRPDLERPIDLVEEIARLYGYNEIPFEAPRIQLDLLHDKKWEIVHSRIRDILNSSGLCEAVNYSFSAQKGEEGIPIMNPLAEDLAFMRSDLSENMLQTVILNHKRQNHQIGLYELGVVFEKGDKGYIEKRKLCAAISNHQQNDWKNNPPQSDFFDLKGILENLLACLGLQARLMDATPQSEDLDPLYFQQIQVRGKTVGHLGQIQPKALQKHKIFQAVSIFEIDLEQLYEGALKVQKFQEFSLIPSAQKQLALITPKEIPAKDVLQVIRSLKIKTLEDFHVFDLYTGKGVPENHKSLGVNFVFRDPAKTLTEEEMDESVHKILDALHKKHGISLRP